MGEISIAANIGGKVRSSVAKVKFSVPAQLSNTWSVVASPNLDPLENYLFAVAGTDLKGPLRAGRIGASTSSPPSLTSASAK